MRWDRAHINLTRSLTELLREYWEDRSHSLRREIDDLTQEMKDTTPAAEYDHIHLLLTRYAKEAQDAIDEKEKQKIRKKRGMDEEEDGAEASGNTAN